MVLRYGFGAVLFVGAKKEIATNVPTKSLMTSNISAVRCVPAWANSISIPRINEMRTIATHCRKKLIFSFLDQSKRMRALKAEKKTMWPRSQSDLSERGE